MNFPIPKVSPREQKLIVALLKSNSQEGIQLLYKKYTPILTAIIISIVKDNTVSSDLLQEVVIKIVKHIHHYTDTKGSLTTWIVKITRNHCFDYLRSKRYKNHKNTQPLQLLSENDFNYVNNYFSLQSEIIDIKKAINALPSELRTFIIESYFNGLTHQQIADKYNYPLGTVKSKILKTLKILRRYILNR